MRKLDPDDPRPPYRQIADAVRAAIVDGSVSPGEKLPSYAELASDFGVSIGVVKRAFAELRDQRLIVVRQGQGSFVRTGQGESGAPPAPTLEELLAALKDVSRRLDDVERRLADR